MKKLRCVVVGNNPILENMRDCLKEFGHYVLNQDKVAQIDYVFIEPEIISSLDNEDLPHIWFGLEALNLKVFIYIKNQSFLLIDYRLQDFFDLGECLEELVIYLARNEVNPKTLDPINLPITSDVTHESTKIGEVNSNNTDFLLGCWKDVITQYSEVEAVVDVQHSITYSQLDNKSNFLAHEILSKYQQLFGATDLENKLVGIVLERNCSFIVSMFAVIKAGAGFVPIDPDLPPERLMYIIEDANIKLVITEQKLVSLINSNNVETIIYEGKNTPSLADNYRLPTVHESSTAYIIYTSGTTGKPKGAIISRSNLQHLIVSTIKGLKISPTDKVMQFAKFSFDASIWEIFPTLFSGASLHICSEIERSDTNKLIEFINKHKISIVTFPPALLKIIPYVTFADLHTIVVAGESCDSKTAIQWSEKYRFINAYGPTEATVCSSMHEYQYGDLPNNIGKPPANTQLYVLDENMELVPIGVVGELYIGGAGVASGYLNKYQLTNERFIENEFASSEDLARGYNRLYKTGDLVRWLPDGNLEYIGRNDFQIKLRGYRIEPGEIEASLHLHPDILNVLVLLNKSLGLDGGLVCYYTSKSGSEIKNLSEFLSQQIPDYMIPQMFILLDKLPLTVNGKIDRKALLSLKLPEIRSDEISGYEKMATATEMFLQQEWQRLLKINTIGRNSHFFELGGHSVLVMHLLVSIRKEFNCHLVPKDIFENPLLSVMAQMIDIKLQDKKQSILVDDRVVISQVNDMQVAAIPVQKSYWLIDYFGDNDAKLAFLTPVFYNLAPSFNAETLNNAMRMLIERHEILRTRFIETEGSIYQVRDLPALNLKITRGFESDAELWMKQQASILVNMEQGPLFMPALYEATDSNRKILSLTHHHILADGYAIDIMLRDLFLLYEQAAGKPVKLPDLPFQYVDFAAWYAKYLATDEIMHKHEKYWQEHLPKNPEFTIPADCARPAHLTYAGDVYAFQLQTELRERLTAYTKEHKVTEFTVLLTAFYILLAKYSGESTVNVGIPFANRHYAGVENMVGCMINTLPFEYHIDGDLTTLQFINDLSYRFNELSNHSIWDSSTIVEHFGVTSLKGFSPLYQILFVSELFNIGQENNGLNFDHFERVNYLNKTSKVDLSAYLLICNSKLVINFEYNTNLYQEKTVHNLARYYQRVLLELIQGEKSINKINFLDQDELLNQNQWVRGDKIDIPVNLNLIQAFKDALKQYPANNAVIFKDRTYTYQELDFYSDQLAEYLLKQHNSYYKKSFSPEDKIILAYTRDSEIIIAILATLKIGGVFVPVDINNGIERVNYIIEDSRSPILITNLKQFYEQFAADLLCIIPDLNPNLMQSEEFELPSINPDSAAYVLYTSGTTGKPKGVVVTHHNLLNLYYANLQQYKFDSSDHIAQYCSFSFDSFCADWTSALFSGASLYIVSERIKLDLQLFSKFLEINQITYMDIPTAIIHLFSHEDFERLHGMRIIKVGGEKLQHINVPNTVKFKLYNAYGPTETTVESVLYQVTNFNDDFFPIGKPLANTQLYVLNENMELVPIGVAGELYIGGAGVASGYLNKYQLTNERFIENKFASAEDLARGYNRLYKTGDLVRWLPDGNLEYIGRNDFQIKLRGYRIEPGEIEASLHQHPDILNVLVLLNKSLGLDGGLVCYYTSKSSSEIKNLSEFLAQQIPDYMIPQMFILLDKLPLTVNGKIDRKALLSLKLPEIRSDEISSYEKIATATEKFLQQEWQRLLKINTIGRNSHFFELGGHSVLVMHLLVSIRKEFNCHLVPKDIFENPLLSVMAQMIDNKLQDKKQSILVDDRVVISRVNDMQVATTPIQQALYMINNYDSQAALSYITPLLFEVTGYLDKNLLTTAISKLTERHEILRTRFIETEGTIYQVRDLPALNLTITRGFESDAELWMKQQASILVNMEQGPLFMPALYEATDSNRKILSLTHHHILADGYAIDIMLRDLFLLYEQAAGKPVKLPDLPFQYVDFAAWYAKYLATDEIMHKHEKYWQEHLPKNPEFTIPADCARPAHLTYAGDVYAFQLQTELRERLTAYTKEHKVTEFTVLLTAFYILLAKYSGESTVNVGIPFANRHYAGVENMVGCMINTLPFEYHIDGDLTTLQLINDLNSKFIELQEMQDSSSLTLSGCSQQIPAGYRNLYQVMFVMQNTFACYQFGKLHLQTIHLTNGTTKADLTFQVQVSEDNLFINVEYNNYLYNEVTIERLTKYYIIILNTILIKDIPARDVSLIDDEHLTKMLQTWVRNNQVSTSKDNVIKLFMQQAAVKAESTAVVCNGKKITYAELDLRSTQLSNYLIEKHKNNHITAVFLERDINLVIAVLAILKSGGAYLPLSTNLPVERINYMLDNANVDCIISSSKLVDDILFSYQAEIINIDKFNYSLFGAQYTNTIVNCDRAYVIYTSGSTGEPKGVVVNHQSLQNTIVGLSEIYNVNKHKFKITAFASFIFDVFTSELFASLIFGGELHLLADEIRIDTELLANYFIREKIHFCFLPPTVLEVLPHRDYPDLDAIIFAGETCSAQVGNYWSDKVRLFNCYGPTETTIYATCARIYSKSNINCIGKPLPNNLAYVLDENLNLLPSGVIGELYIGGLGVACGYLNKPELTSERFIDNNFATNDDLAKGYKQLYKTGDLVRWLPDGNLEYIGRNDFQIKLRGYRIELGEIEKVIATHDKVKQAVVIVDGKVSGERLIAYFTHDNSIIANSDIIGELRELVTSKLPVYMIPSLFIELEKIPLTINGKVDRNTLKLNELDFSQLQQVVKPTMSKESTLLELFSNILGIDYFGVEHSFFDFGGNSIQAAKLIAKINDKFNKNFMISTLYQMPTVRKFASQMEIGYIPLIELNSGLRNDNPKLFMFHTARGSAEVYFKFAQMLTEIQLIGVESYNLYHSEPKLKLTDLVNIYALDILKIYPDEEVYYLGGWSFGGLLAYEVARIFSQQYDKTCQVILFDTLSCEMFEQYTELALAHTYRVDSDYGVADKYIEQSKVVGEIAEKMVISHKLNKVSFPVYLLKAITIDYLPDEAIQNFIGDYPDNGWRQYCDNLEIIQVNSDHERLFDDDVLNELINIINTIIRKD